MKLVMFHGRRTVGEELSGWGFNGPSLEGVIAVHFTYGLSTVNVYFKSYEQAAVAHDLTGWEWWDDESLSMKFDGDLLVGKDLEGRRSFYGDWKLQASKDWPAADKGKD